jgi:hypothetical protein
VSTWLASCPAAAPGPPIPKRDIPGMFMTAVLYSAHWVSTTKGEPTVWYCEGTLVID